MTAELSYSKKLKLDMISYRAKNACCRKNTHRAMRACVPSGSFRDVDVAAYYELLTGEFGVSDGMEDLSDMSSLRCAGCRAALLRGIFLAAGSVSDPARHEANLDLSFRSEACADAVFSLLSSFGFDFRRRKRRQSTILYMKSGEAIGGFFAEAGINRVLFDVSNAGLISDVANFANRRYNADISNLKKSTDASERVCDAIRYLEKEGKLHLLDETLAEAARLRIEYPELTLSQLAAASPTNVTKSTLANRLRRIVSVAEEHGKISGDRA